MDQRRYKPEAPMCERITARCPATGEAIATEIACDSDSFARVPFLVATDNCPACGAPHTWEKSETFLIKASTLANAA